MWKAATKQITGTNDGKLAVPRNVSRHVEEPNNALPSAPRQSQTIWARSR